jgi:hypothetical protein
VPGYLYAWIGVNSYDKHKQEKLKGLVQKLGELSADDLLYDNTVSDTMDILIEKIYEKFTRIYKRSLNSQNTQDSQAIKALEISGNSVKCQRCSVDFPIVEKLSRH